MSTQNTTVAETHWLSATKKKPSDNWSYRPSGEISLIVIHCISLPRGNYSGQYIEQLFCNQLDCSKKEFTNLQGLRVSAHVLIRRAGELIQFVPFDKCAWHAGESVYRGRRQCNDFSIGIELEGVDDDVFTRQQYEVLARLCRELCNYYPELHKTRITGHSDIAMPRGRKTDPGNCFDWGFFFSLFNS